MGAAPLLISSLLATPPRLLSCQLLASLLLCPLLPCFCGIAHADRNAACPLPQARNGLYVRMALLKLCLQDRALGH